jgi:hypothetical protein
MTWRIVPATSPRLGLLADLRGACRVHHAMLQVVGEQRDRHLLQRPGHRGDLDHHVGAVGVGVDHLAQAADLALDLREPGQVVRLAGRRTRGGGARRRSGRRPRPGAPRPGRAGGQGGHRPPSAPAGLSLRPEPIRSRSLWYSSASISPRARRLSRMRLALPGYVSRSRPGLQVAFTTRAKTAQISSPPERDHPDPRQGDLPERPAAAVSEHHQDHLLRPGPGWRHP